MAHAGVIAVVYAARASVAVLCHTQYSHALGAAIRLFVYKNMMSLRAMYHQYQVGILLYGAALAQMAKIGWRGLVFRLTVELTRHDDGAFNRTRQGFQLAAALRHLLLAVAVVQRGAYQLKVEYIPDFLYS